jgi:hypothetical protein
MESIKDSFGPLALSKHTSATTASSSRTSASVDGKGKRLARHSWSRRSTKWSAYDSSRSSRCSGRCAGPIFCCRPGRGFSTRIWTTYSAVGIQNSGRNHQRRSQTARRLDPDFLALSMFSSRYISSQPFQRASGFPKLGFFCPTPEHVKSVERGFAQVLERFTPVYGISVSSNQGINVYF